MRVVIASSISGGHLFPAIAFAAELKRKDENCRILLVTGKRKVSIRILKNEGFPFILLQPTLVKFFQNLVQSCIILKREKPQAVVGFGGLLSVPVLLCARLFGIPSIVHEQNVVPGRANLMLSKFADAIAISFQKSRSFFRDKEKIVFTGNPIRSSLKAMDKNGALKGFGFILERFTLFVMGGSQGSHSINQAVVDVFQRLKPEEHQGFQVIHIAGEKDCEMVQARYKALNLNSKVYSFMDKIDAAYAASDLIISRAGASAIFEINSLGKAAILIPYPYARSHQLENARYMSERNMAVLLKDDKDLSQGLYNKISDFYNNREQIQRFSKIQKLETNAARNMVDLIMGLSDDKRG